MSQYFDVGERTLWNPSNGPGTLYVRTVAALEPLAGVPSGIGVGRWGPGDPDSHGIDLPVFTEFVNALVRCYRDGNHRILRALVESPLAVSIVLVQRAGGAVEALAEPPGVADRDIRTGPAAAAPPDRLAELVAQFSVEMAW